MEEEVRSMAQEYEAMRMNFEKQEQECTRKYGPHAVAQLQLPAHPTIKTRLTVRPVQELPVQELPNSPLPFDSVEGDLADAGESAGSQPSKEPKEDAARALMAAIATVEAENRMKRVEEELAALKSTHEKALKSTSMDFLAVHASEKAQMEERAAGAEKGGVEEEKGAKEALDSMLDSMAPTDKLSDSKGGSSVKEGGGNAKEGGGSVKEGGGSVKEDAELDEIERLDKEYEEMMKEKVRLLHESKAKKAARERKMQNLCDLFSMVMFVLVMLLGSAVYKYNQVIEIDCTGNLPDGFVAVETIDVVNSTIVSVKATDGMQLLFYERDGAMLTHNATHSSLVLIPTGVYATSPDVPVCTRQWTWAEGIYYGVVTATTVGYGDYGPTNDNMKGFCIFYIALALVMAGTVIEIGSRYLEAGQDALLNWFDDNPDDMDEPQEAKLALSILLVAVTILTGALFFQYNEGWTFLDSFYWAFITSATIGYGDMSLTK
jgi:hypothetical protein